MFEKQWEYKIVLISKKEFKDGDTLNPYGSKGWEAVGFDYDGGLIRVLMKRPK